MMVPDRQVQNVTSIPNDPFTFPCSEMFQSRKLLIMYSIILDHHACQTCQLRFPRKRDSGPKVFCLVQTLRRTAVKAGKSLIRPWIR